MHFNTPPIIKTETKFYGHMPDGRDVYSILLRNSQGLSACILNYGATLQSLELPDRIGNKADIVLGYSDLKSYLEGRHYFGSTIGRFANRLAQGYFQIDGIKYQVLLNDGLNSLHGGPKGFDKVLWEIISTKSEPDASVKLRYISLDGDQGYPGTLTIDVTYSLDENNQLTIAYRATTDKPTIINITNHAYWNLSGEGSEQGAMETYLTIPANFYLPTKPDSIPTGEIRSVKHTIFDFRKPREIRHQIREAKDEQIIWGRGYDHTWIIEKNMTNDLHLMAKALDPHSKRGFELWSNQPGLQFYSGNFLDGTSLGKSKKLYRQGDAFCLEPQIFPNTPNQNSFGSARLDPKQIYHNSMVYRFTNNL